MRAVRRHKDQQAALAQCVILDRSEQFAAQSLPPAGFRNPQVRNEAAAAPGVAADAGFDGARFAFVRGCEEFGVVVPGGCRVELVDALRQEGLERRSIADAHRDRGHVDAQRAR